MDEIQKQAGRKNKILIVIPIIIAIIVVAVFVYLDYKNNPKPEPGPSNGGQTSVYKPKPVSPAENPFRAIPLDPVKVNQYGCAGPQHLETTMLNEPDRVWEIKKNGDTTRISLGKYGINAPANTVFDIKKLWLYFYSEGLSERDDGIYALESSYTSRMLIVVNDYEKEIKLGGDEYMLIELDYPLGDLYPYEKAAVLEYELIIEFKCKNITNGKCLNNDNEALNYLNDAGIISTIRFFAEGCQTFEKDVEIEAKFKY